MNSLPCLNSYSGIQYVACLFVLLSILALFLSLPAALGLWLHAKHMQEALLCIVARRAVEAAKVIFKINAQIYGLLIEFDQ